MDNIKEEPLDLSIKRDRNSSPPSRTSGSAEIMHLLTKPTSRRNPCPTCGIGFSSEKTLQAHAQFYCTKKVTAPSISSNTVLPSDPGKVRAATVFPTTETSSLKHSSVEVTSDAEKSKSGQFCTYCAFRANTIRGLRSHVTKYHLKDSNASSKDSKVRSSNPSRQSVIVSSAKRPKIDGTTAAPMTVSHGVTEKKKYCKYCDIYFKYLSTFLAHRKFYCTVRKDGIGEAAKPIVTEPETTE